MLFAPKEKGQGLVEYAIILALVAIVVIAIMRLLGQDRQYVQQHQRLSAVVIRRLAKTKDSALGQSPWFFTNLT